MNKNIKVAKDLLKLAKALVADTGAGDAAGAVSQEDAEKAVKEIFNNSDFSAVGNEAQQSMEGISDSAKDFAEEVEDLKDNRVASSLFKNNHVYVAKYLGEIKVASDNEYREFYAINAAAENFYHESMRFLNASERYRKAKIACNRMKNAASLGTIDEETFQEASDATVELGAKVIECINRFIKSLNSFIATVKEKVESFKKWIAEKAGEVVNGVFALGKIVGKVILGAIAGAIWVAFKLIKGAYNLCKAGIKKIIDVSKKFGEMISDALDDIGDAVTELEGDIEEGIKKMGDDIQGGCDVIVNAINKAISACLGVIDGIKRICKGEAGTVEKIIL